MNFTAVGVNNQPALRWLTGIVRDNGFNAMDGVESAARAGIADVSAHA
ncbi:MAG: hypothetical protein R3309_01570 [Reinekea sp.]|nr:hypothetical protein [Reinekea sp.]